MSSFDHACHWAKWGKCAQGQTICLRVVPLFVTSAQKGMQWSAFARWQGSQTAAQTPAGASQGAAAACTALRRKLPPLGWLPVLPKKSRAATGSAHCMWHPQCRSVRTSSEARAHPVEHSTHLTAGIGGRLAKSLSMLDGCHHPVVTKDQGTCD